MGYKVKIISLQCYFGWSTQYVKVEEHMSLSMTNKPLGEVEYVR